MDIIDIIKNLTNQKEMKHGYKQIKSKKADGSTGSS